MHVIVQQKIAQQIANLLFISKTSITHEFANHEKYSNKEFAFIH